MHSGEQVGMGKAGDKKGVANGFSFGRAGPLVFLIRTAVVASTTWHELYI